MKEDQNLTRALLERLSEVEASLPQTASVTIQPPVEGMFVPAPFTIPGYTDKEIADHLELLVRHGLVETVGSGPAIGIQFKRLTDAGHRALENPTCDESEKATAKLSDAVILKPTFMGMSIDLYKAWGWTRDKLRRVRPR